MTRTSTSAELTWKSDLVFDAASSGDTHILLDSASKRGPSPMQALAMAISGCMAMDVVDIVNKGRHGLRGLRVQFTGRRAGEPPKRFEAVTLHFVITGNVPAQAV
jgi:putative redox protein